MISVKLNGRLGNQMFQYAVLRSVSYKTNYVYSFPNDWLGNDMFKNIEYGHDIRFFNYNNTFIESIKNNGYNEKIFDITDNTLIDGYWQSEKYFKDYRENLKYLFYTDKKDIDENICIIHFRGTDYVRENYLLSKEWYNDAMNEIRKLNKNIVFKIITDDCRLASIYFPNIEICSSNIKDDFGVIRDSKYKIISPSSFSWWCAWLGADESKFIISPMYWFNNRKKNFYVPNDIDSEYFKKLL